MQKFNVSLEVESQYEVHLNENFFYGKTEEQWLSNFSNFFFKVESIEDIVEHSTLFYTKNGNGFLEGVGVVSDYDEEAMVLIKESYGYNSFAVTKE